MNNDSTEKSKRNKEICLKMLDFLEKEYKGFKERNEASSSFNLAIFYGLALGILGNVLVTAFFEYLSDSIKNSLWPIIMVCLIIIMLLLYIIIKENKRNKKTDRELSNKISQVLADRDAIENRELELDFAS